MRSLNFAVTIAISVMMGCMYAPVAHFIVTHINALTLAIGGIP